MNFELTPNTEFLFEWNTRHSFILHHWCQNYSSVLLKLVYVMKCYNDSSFAVLSNVNIMVHTKFKIIKIKIILCIFDCILKC